MANIGEEITRKLIESAGIKLGMRIMDLGCGNGNVSFLLSGYVGPDGIVVGVDANETAIKDAIGKSVEDGISNTNFFVEDITKGFKNEYSDFDAIIVRRVLMYLQNPVETITKATKCLKPNGVFLVQENDLSLTPIGFHSMPLHEKIIKLITRTLESENVNFKMGFDLNAVLANSGLKIEKIWAEAVLSTQNQHTTWAFLADVMKDRMLKHSIISNVAELELDTLSDRLYAERMKNTNTFISDMVFCAIARI
jgi:SAM-dependent methyltransferase